MSAFFKKPNPWRLLILLTILAVCGVKLHQKIQLETALVDDGGALKAAVWRLGAFLPPGDQDLANMPRELQATLPNGTALAANLDFDDSLLPWPARLTLTVRPDQTDHPDHLVLEMTHPFDRAGVQVMDPAGNSPADETQFEEAAERLAALADTLSATWPRLEKFDWQSVAPGLETATAYLRYGLRLGPRQLYLARLEPDKYDFKPWHEADFQIDGFKDGVNIDGWSRLLPQAALLINGGQYELDRSYIGLLRRDGTWLVSERHGSWQGFLVSDPGPDAPPNAPRAAVLDLELKEPPLQPEQYRNVMQSLMLLDSRGRIRVKDSYYLASRAAIGQDREGRIWAIMCPGAISLRDLAQALKDPSLDLVRVLCLDGGFEAQIWWRNPDGSPVNVTAEYLVFPNETVYAPQMFRSLPSVIAAIPLSLIHI